MRNGDCRGLYTGVDTEVDNGVCVGIDDGVSRKLGSSVTLFPSITNFGDVESVRVIPSSTGMKSLYTEVRT